MYNIQYSIHKYLNSNIKFEFYEYVNYANL